MKQEAAPQPISVKKGASKKKQISAEEPDSVEEK